MAYIIEFYEKAIADTEKHKASGQKQLVKKIAILHAELSTTPKTGTGKPHALKNYSTTTYARKINDKHRLVYEIFEDQKIVRIISAYGHYGEK